MNDEAIQAARGLFEKFLAPKLKDEDAWTDDLPEGCAFSPPVLCFYSEDPDPDFAGFKGKNLLDSDHVFSEMDGDRRWRLERLPKNGATVLSFTEGSRTLGACNVRGYVLVCAEGSLEDTAFRKAALYEVLAHAVTPLRDALAAAQNCALCSEDEARALAQQVTFDPAFAR